MKAIRVRQFGDPSVMKLEEVSETSAGAGQVLIDLKAAGVNPVDTYIRSGQYASLPPLPYTPGADAAGVVAAVGKDVHDFNPGDRVYISGTSRAARQARTRRERSALLNRFIHSRSTFRFRRAPASVFPMSPPGERSSKKGAPFPARQC